MRDECADFNIIKSFLYDKKHLFFAVKVWQKNEYYEIINMQIESFSWIKFQEFK